MDGCGERREKALNPARAAMSIKKLIDGLKQQAERGTSGENGSDSHVGK
jgi:hypothetical protein